MPPSPVSAAPRPILILTRPEAQAAEFARQVEAAYPGALDILIAPVQRIVWEEITTPPPAEAALIFTSVNGVKSAQYLGITRRRTAFCVGGVTAQAAREAGFDIRVGPGTVEHLLQMILADPPGVPLVHLRGRHSRGDLASRLTASGIECSEIQCYQQVEMDLTPQAQAVLAGDSPVILPVFSPRSAALVTANPPPRAPIYLIAISQPAARAVQWRPLQPVEIVDKPTGDHILGAIGRRIPPLTLG